MRSDLWEHRIGIANPAELEKDFWCKQVRDDRTQDPQRMKSPTSTDYHGCCRRVGMARKNRQANAARRMPVE